MLEFSLLTGGHALTTTCVAIFTVQAVKNLDQQALTIKVIEQATTV